MIDESSHVRGGHPPRQDWRGTRYAIAVVAFLLSMGSGGVGAAGCASDGIDVEGGVGAGDKRPRLPVPVEFRDHLARLILDGRFTEATAALREMPPELLARSASERGDILYLSLMGVGPQTPGLAPGPKTPRTWLIPGTSEYPLGDDVVRYNVVAYDFAKAFNVALAKEEKGLR